MHNAEHMHHLQQKHCIVELWYQDTHCKDILVGKTLHVGTDYCSLTAMVILGKDRKMQTLISGMNAGMISTEVCVVQADCTKQGMAWTPGMAAPIE